MGQATARAPVERPAVLNTPLFRLVIEQFDAPRRWLVLDLGGASTEMLSLLGQFRCRVEIADLAGSDGLALLNAEQSADSLARVAASLLPDLRDEGLDVIFCWDLLNYLNRKALSALMHAIAAGTRPGALAHGLIAYADSTMPEQPGRFVPTEDSKLVNRRGSSTEVVAPRYSPEDLELTMGRFEIERAMLLANGMQEFLFRLQ